MKSIVIPYMEPFEIVFDTNEISATVKTKRRTIASIEKKIDKISNLVYEFICKNPENYSDFFVIVSQWDYDFYKAYQTYYKERELLSKYQLLPRDNDQFKTDKPGLMLPNRIRVLPGNVKKPVIGWEP